MPWIVLLISAVLEAVWATALGASDGLSRPGPSLIFIIGLAASMLGLGHAARHIPIATAYAVWTGVGAALTVSWSMLVGTEDITALRVVFLVGIVGCVVGLKIVKPKKTEQDPLVIGEGQHPSLPAAPGDAADSQDQGQSAKAPKKQKSVSFLASLTGADVMVDFIKTNNDFAKRD